MTVWISDKLAEYQAKLAQYAAEVDLKRAVFDQYAHSLHVPLFTADYKGQEKVMAADTQGREVFTVIEVANGYMANVRGGGTVVGATLSDVCTAAQAEAASVKIKQEAAASQQYPDYQSQSLAGGVEKFKHTNGPNVPQGKISSTLENKMLKFLFNNKTP